MALVWRQELHLRKEGGGRAGFVMLKVRSSFNQNAWIIFAFWVFFFSFFLFHMSPKMRTLEC